MGWLLRPGAVIGVSMTLVLVAGAVLLWPGDASADRAALKPLAEADREVVWLNPATSGAAWERFVAGVRRLCADRPELGVALVPGAEPFPGETTTVPELALARTGAPGRIWFRWYKLTADLGPAEWVRAFARRRPAPVAVIGGGSSDRARDLARELAAHAGDFDVPPALLLTSATADQVDGGERLTDIYPGRTFRFCFTDRQMAEAVSDFVWSQDDLRPDVAPVYLTRWFDDPYSADLFDQFHDVLGPEGLGRRLVEARATRALARRWAALGGSAVGRLGLGWLYAEDCEPPDPFWSAGFPTSVGAYAQPNRYEVEGAEGLVDELAQHPQQRRPLLVLPATAQPARRFLRALLRAAPDDARRFVVVTGDAIDFNTVYRDRDLAWPVQDFPVPLVFFCHRNPVDAVGFRPQVAPEPPDVSGPTSTGTHDLLLNRDVAAAVVEAIAEGGTPLAEALRASGRFTASGDPPGGSGEYVVCLRPVRAGERVLPQARLQVWRRNGAAGAWAPVAIGGRPELAVSYTAGRGEPEPGG